MKLAMSRVNVWAAEIEDRPGGLAHRLQALKEAGVNLEFVISRRAPEKEGTGVVFVTPIKGAKQVRAAQAAWFNKTDSLHCLRIQGPDKPGMGADLTTALGQAGINLRGVSAAAIGKQFVMFIAFDNDQDVAKAMKVIRKL